MPPGEWPGVWITSKARSPRSMTSPCSRMRPAGAGGIRYFDASQPSRHAVEHLVGRVAVGERPFVARVGEDVRLGAHARSGRETRDGSRYGRNACGWRRRRACARVTSATWRRRLTWPSPLSNSRSRSRPRTCQMLQRKNGLIHGSWISVTPSAMRMVSYQWPCVDDRKRRHGHLVRRMTSPAWHETATMSPGLHGAAGAEAWR